LVAELGLSDLARLANFDKATTRRLLVALAKHGHIEQNPENRRYRIGPGVIRLARLREIAQPITAIVEPVLRTLTESTGETSHFGLLSGWDLYTVGICESDQMNRIHSILGEPLPLHATATGMAVLAYLGPEGIAHVSAGTLESYTDQTLVERSEIEVALKKARRNGFVMNRELFVADVCSVGAAVFDHLTKPIGAIGVFAPKTRFDKTQRDLMQTLVVDAAAEITDKIGGYKPTLAASADGR